VAGTLPPVGWGLGRLDAVGIIFNRISGTDVGPPPDLLIEENMKINAPVRYPFLWNTPMQNQTDWAGFVLNGNSVFALARNTGQALAFANFEPKRSSGPFSFNYANSINFDGLKRLEELIMKMGPPKWPREWPIDSKLAEEGQKIYERQCSEGCHEKKEVHSLRDLFVTTWETPVRNVGTDTRQYDELGWRVKTGALKGAGIPLIAKQLDEEDYAVHMMFSAVAGSILDYKLSLGSDAGTGDGFGSFLPPSGQSASSAPRSSPAPVEASSAPPSSALPAGGPESLKIEPGTLLKRTLSRGEYEARVLEGIWATAPYLHNGSVPTLAELLLPPAKRRAYFNLGAKYDINDVGLDVSQEGPPRYVTDCNELNSGNSRCGHDYGTRLNDHEKKALLEYLKTL
jgi:hypothetical protein